MKLNESEQMTPSASYGTAEAIEESKEKLKFKKEIYDELVGNFKDLLVCAEETLTSNELIKAFVEALQKQMDYHHQQYQYYYSIQDQFK